MLLSAFLSQLWGLLAIYFLQSFPLTPHESMAGTLQTQQAQPSELLHVSKFFHNPSKLGTLYFLDTLRKATFLSQFTLL